jgi:potassium efflux system protein
MKRRKKMSTANTARLMLLWVTLFSAMVTVCNSSFAQTNDSAVTITLEEQQEQIREKQTRLKEEIETVQRSIALSAQYTVEIPSKLLKQQLELLESINRVYEQQLIQVKRSNDLMETYQQLRAELSAPVSKKTVPDAPYSFEQLDELQEQLLLLEGQSKSIADTLRTTDASLEAAKDKVKVTGQSLRRIREELEAEKKNATASPAFILAELSDRHAREEVSLRKLSLENEKRERDIYQFKIELSREQLSFLASRIQFTREELDERLFKIENDTVALKKTLEAAKAKEDLSNSRWLNVKKQLVDKSFPPGEEAVKEQELGNLKVWNDAYHLKVEMVSRRIEYLDMLKKIWTYRYALYNKTDLVELGEWGKEVKQALEELERENRLVMSRQADCSNTIVSLEKKLESVEDKSKKSGALEDQLKAYTSKESQFKKAFEKNQATQREYQKLLNEISRREKHKSIKERLSSVWIIAVHVWGYEVTTVEDHPITVGKMIIALVLLVVGFILSKRFSLQIGSQLIKRFSMDQAAAFAFQQILYYVLLVLLVLFVLSLVRIPLTFFTVLGGALAIGVGFGSQNIVNNFLSGLILMMERPIKIGDIVEVENIQGTVEWLGARSTIIKTFGNLRLVIPNSTLLQNKVINWSLTDDIVRREVVVGVIYGSPVRTVESMLKQAASEHPLVEGYPQPLVLFEDFGDNSLIFTLIIWINMARTGRAQLSIRQVESDIRFRIDELFRENQLVIAFPQRDVHLDTLKPLEIRVKQE